MKNENKKFQALIMIEAFPMSIQRAPICSFLEKILENLEMSLLIDEIFIFCNKNKSQIESIIAQRKNRKPVKLLFTECGDSIGDRLREVQSMRKITNDFVLIRYIN